MILSREDDFRFPVNDKIIICDKKIKTKTRRGYCCRYAALPSPLAAIGHLAVFLLLYTHVRCCRWVYCDNLSHLHPCHWVFCCVLLLYTHVRCCRWVYCANLSRLHPCHWAYLLRFVVVHPCQMLAMGLLR